MITKHNIFVGASQNMSYTHDESVHLVVTSPPYPMIEMWDEIMAKQNSAISDALLTNPNYAFELMHQELDKVWKECYRVLREGGFLCINIGDATRTINANFSLFNNHSRIIRACVELGFVGLPNIIWRKQTNSPNKFMGSGMLPCGAYMTLEHEWILIFRKGNKRTYKTAEDKAKRMRSSYFWEERNVWFSDIWDVKGTKQAIAQSSTRERSAAYPFEIPYRLINMFSQQGDMVLDPFIGTGTTTLAAMCCGRNSCGYDIDSAFKAITHERIMTMNIDNFNTVIKKRLDDHVQFVNMRQQAGKEIKHFNQILNVPVMTGQETKISFDYIQRVFVDDAGNICVGYQDKSDLTVLPFVSNQFLFSNTSYLQPINL